MRKFNLLVEVTVGGEKERVPHTSTIQNEEQEPCVGLKPFWVRMPDGSLRSGEVVEVKEAIKGS